VQAIRDYRRKQLLRSLTESFIGVDFVWADLTPPIYIIGPSVMVHRYNIGDKELGGLFNRLLQHGAVEFFADMSACTTIRTVLSLYYGFGDVNYYAADNLQDMTTPEKLNILKHDIVLIGGPFANPIHTEILRDKSEYKEIQEAFARIDDDQDIIDVLETGIINHRWLLDPIFLPKGRYKIMRSVNIEGRKFCTITGTENDVEIYQDHGLFLKRTNPFDYRKHIFLIAGSRSAGTQAAAVSSVSRAMDILYEPGHESPDDLTVVARIRGSKSNPEIRPRYKNLVKIVHPLPSEEYDNTDCITLVADHILGSMISPAHSVESRYMAHYDKDIKDESIAHPLSDRMDPQHEIDIVTRVIENFHNSARELGQRRKGKPIVSIEDEYDLQDLLYVVLKAYVADLRKEEYTPMHAGRSKRIDLISKELHTVIELKCIRDEAHAKNIGDELKIDIQSYPFHPYCGTIIFYIYDPQGKIKDPKMLIRDLSGKHTIKGRDIKVKLFVKPE